jgi:hypothetical protein
VIGWVDQAESSYHALSFINQSKSSLSSSQSSLPNGQTQTPSQPSSNNANTQVQNQSQSGSPSTPTQSNNSTTQNPPTTQANNSTSLVGISSQAGCSNNQAQALSQAGDQNSFFQSSGQDSHGHHDGNSQGGDSNGHHHHDRSTRAGGNFQDTSVVCSQTTFSGGNVVIHQANVGTISGTFSGTYLTFVNLTMSDTGTGTYVATDICACSVGDSSGTLNFYEAGTLVLVNGVWLLYSTATIVQATGDLSYLQGSIALQGVVYISSGLTIGTYSGNAQ